MELDFQKDSIDDILAKLERQSSSTPFFNDVSAFLEAWKHDNNKIVVKSSGTTGPVKEIQFSKGSLIRSAEITIQEFNLKVGDRLLCALPISFIAGKMMLVRAMVLKAKLLLFEPMANPIRKLEDTVDFAAFTPYQIQHILQHNPEKLKLISKIILGGSKVDQHLSERLANFKCEFYETFGMSETLTHVAIRPINGPSRSLHFKVLDAFRFDLNSEACLQIWADHLEDSPITTQDIIQKIDGTHFLWLGRKDNVINSGGVKVYPETIERKLAHKIDVPFIISKTKDELLGEKVVLVLETEDIYTLDAFDFSDLDPYEAPREIHIVAQFPRNNNDKIIRLNSYE